MYRATDDPYCYPGTGVLKNRLNLRKQADLQAFEAEITALNDFEVKFRKPDGVEQTAKLNLVAAILLQPVPETRKERLEANRRGVLLRAGDFLEGDFSRLDSGQVVLSSVLFGVKKFNLKTEVSALVLAGQ